MKPRRIREFWPEEETVFAKTQPQYKNLPAYRSLSGDVLTCWRLSLRERPVVLFRGDVYLAMRTFNQLLQPVNLQVEKPLQSCEAGFVMAGWNGQSSRLYCWLMAFQTWRSVRSIRRGAKKFAA